MNDLEYKNYLVSSIPSFIFINYYGIFEALTFFYANQQLSTCTTDNLCNAEEPFSERNENEKATP